MTTYISPIQVKHLNSPLELGDKVKFAATWKPLRMVEGVIVDLSIPPGEWKNEWCYRIKYSLLGKEGADWVDHTDPSLYKIVV